MKLPPYDTFPIISGDKILLRQVLPSDIKNIVEISYYDSVQATTTEEASVMQEKINQNFRDGNSIHWGIADKVTNRLVGTCGYYRGFEKSAGELGCILLPEFRGQGFMTSAMQLAIRFGLNDIGLNRIWAITTKGNINAIKLLNRLQFVKVADLGNDEIEYELATKK
ncbi:MAG: GNAT family N-acetyltransferase [Lewinellaceae bacterium]|nr:GNAT family N-acetyltransferase [Saprospiraceae bacterium]MCB9330931.1 GNAT family N-acetyltransferase [Lewinellaceae bacterium]